MSVREIARRAALTVRTEWLFVLHVAAWTTAGYALLIAVKLAE